MLSISADPSIPKNHACDDARQDRLSHRQPDADPEGDTDVSI
jgi:hypothetical protein